LLFLAQGGDCLKGIFATSDAGRGASLVLHATEAGLIAADRIREMLQASGN